MLDRTLLSHRTTPLFRSLWPLALLALSCLGPSRAGAQSPPGPNVAATASLRSNFAPVQVQGRELFDVAASGRLSANERAAKVNRRLRNLIERRDQVRPFGPGDVRQHDGEPLITLGGIPIMTVTTDDAADNLATPQELALTWGQRMASAVADAREVRLHPLQGAGILIRNSFRDLVTSLLQWLPRLAGAIIVWLVFLLLAWLIRKIVAIVTERTHLDPNLRQLVRALSFYGVWTVGFVAILSTLGFQTTGIVTALGVSGFVFGFAFKDILSHFLAGLMLLIGRQFRIGDQIVLQSYEGTVERIELRAMHLRTYDNRLVLIPNAEVFTSAVTSNTASPHRRREVVIAIGYDQEIEAAERVALDAVRHTPGVLHEPAADVLVDELGSANVNLRIRFFVNSLRADYLRVGSDCMRRVKEAFAREGISLPSDVQKVELLRPEQTSEVEEKNVGPAPSPPSFRQRGNRAA